MATTVPETAPETKGARKAGPKSMPGSEVAIEHVVWVHTAYDALKAYYAPGVDGVIEAAKQEDPDFPVKRGAVKNIGFPPAKRAFSREDGIGRIGFPRRIRHRPWAKSDGVNKRPCGKC